MDGFPAMSFLSSDTTIAIIIALGVFGLLSICLLIVTILGKRKKKKFDYNEFIEALGDLKNIESIDFKNSRLNIVVKDKKEINKEKLQDLGASAIIMTSKKVTLIMGVISEQICTYINNKLS
ncbi:MAG: hypothetical protein E7184_01505 [Erysipelotrichaceae bacterium]|nr:hypothetical protein [Erysipelotrichaceae bacterium]